MSWLSDTTGIDINVGKGKAKINGPSPTDQFANDAINAIFNYYSYGFIGVDDGKLSKGVVSRAIDETFGELTGRNMARRQANLSEKAIADAKLESEKQRKFAIQKQQSQEMQMSGAASQRTGSNGGSGSYGGNGTSSVEQQMAVDFLGL